MAETKKKSKAKAGKRRRAQRPRKKNIAERATPVGRVLARLETRLVAAGLEDRVLETYRDLVARVQDRTASTREKAEQQLEDLLERAQSSRASEALSELEERVITELDEVLERVGLMRAARVDELVEKAEKRGASRERRRQRDGARRASAKKTSAKKASAKKAESE